MRLVAAEYLVHVLWQLMHDGITLSISKFNIIFYIQISTIPPLMYAGFPLKSAYLA